MFQQTITITTNNRAAINITRQVNDFFSDNNISDGLCHLFVRHTSAALMITANNDSDVLLDIEDYLQDSIADTSDNYRHNNYKGDMAGHIRSILLGVDKTIPIIDGKLALGRLQGLFLYEFNDKPNKRDIIISCYD